MRRLIAVVLAAMLILAFAAPVAAEGPERYRFEPEVLEPEIFDGACDFDVLLEDSFAVGTFFVFPEDRRGTERWMAVGGYRSTLTNLSTDHSIEISYFGRLEWRWYADGTSEVLGSGQILNWFDAVDGPATSLGQGLWLTTGRVAFHYDADGELVSGTHRGRVVDICAALAAG